MFGGKLVLCDHSSAAGVGGLTGVPRETALKPASRQRLRPSVSQQGGAWERNTPTSLSPLPPSSLLLGVPLAEPDRKPQGRGAHVWVHSGRPAGEGQRVGSEGRTEDIEASGRDPGDQKCWATHGGGSRLFL